MFLLFIGSKKKKKVCLIIFFHKNSGNHWGQRNVIGKEIYFAVASPVCYTILAVRETKNKQEVEVSYFKITPNLFMAVEKKAASLRMSSHLLFGLHSF